MANKKPPRPKKLKLVDKSPIGMTSAEAQELSQRYRFLSHLTGEPPILTQNAQQLKSVAFDRLLYIYIEALCHDAKVESSGLKKRGIASLRAKIIKDIRKSFGRDLSPDDIIKELAKHAPVPAYAKNAIRRDYLRITV